MILSAGRGVRLRPLTDRIPKPLLDVGGEPLIVRHLRRLQRAGFMRAVINISHLGAQIKNRLGDGEEFGVRIEYSPEETPLSAAGGIRLAMARGMLSDEEPFLCVNADIVCDLDFAAARAFSSCHVWLTKNPPTHAGGDFSLGESGELLFPSTDTKTYTGIGVYLPRMFATLESGKKAELLPILQTAIAAKEISGEVYGGLWHDTGTPETLAAARQAIAEIEE